MLSDDIFDLAAGIVADFREKGLRLTTAESCTGGLIVAALTSVSGSSEVIDRGFVAYSDAAKVQMLGVPSALLEAHGSVSEQVAKAMAEGAVAAAQADMAIAVTGIAGPNGATPAKPVGLVYIALAARDADTLVERHVFEGNRGDVRRQTVLRALTLLNHFRS